MQCRDFEFNAIIDYNDAVRLVGTASVSSITIRNLDSAIKERLRVRAAEHGHSMEAEVRRILQTTLTERERPSGRDLYDRIRARFETFGGVDDLELPPREQTREVPHFD